MLGLVLIFASAIMYYFENKMQPQYFSSIPATMWWAIATLTTVGYGDVYPITAAGKLIASTVAILGIGIFAIPTGILAAAFLEEIQREKRESAEAQTCPYCRNRMDRAA